MDLKKIEFFKRDHPIDPTAMLIRGEYSLDMELTIPKKDWDYRKDDAKQLIHDSIERQATHDIMGLSFAGSLNEEARQRIVSALVYMNMQFHITQKDVKENTTTYRDFRLTEELIYELRSMKIEG